MIAALAFERILSHEARGHRLRRAGSVGVAVALHVGLAWYAAHVELPAPMVHTSVTEVSLLPLPKVEPPRPPPAPEPEAPAPPTPKAAPRPRAPAPARSEPPRAASAAPLLTAPETPTAKAEEPVRFVTDPNGTAFGYGVVARGGTAREGTGASTAPLAPAPPKGPPGPAVYQGPLGRPPRLVAYDPCRGFFPTSAQVDRGDASVRVTVAADGRVASVAVMQEQPRAQGFGAAARACLSALRFEPALDTAGHAVVAVAPITVRFSR